AIIDDEGEEIAALVRLAFDGGHQRDGVAVLHDDRAVRLFGELAGFKDKCLVAKGTFDSTCLHGRFLARTGRSGEWRGKRVGCRVDGGLEGFLGPPRSTLRAPPATCGDRAD